METVRVRYTTSADGTKIAYTVVGAGPPVLLLDTFVTTRLDHRLQSGRRAAFYEGLAAKRTVYSFDWRNVGLSDKATDFSPAALTADMNAVTEDAGLGRFDLVSLYSAAGKVALAYAAANHEKVRRNGGAWWSR
jgi:pimeloyl-ACP methyl ester carboxylesterase